MENAIQIVFQIAVLIFSVVIHEVAHGYAALALGDRTAQHAGRLTINPLKHIDPVGSLLLPAIFALSGGPIFGWAKPVPYNPYNLRNQKWGPAIVGAAGPASNIVLALIFGLLIRALPNFASPSSALFLLNFISIASTIALLNLFLAFFNLIPIPPLDGSKVLFALLPYRWYGVQAFLEQWGFFVLLFFIFFLGVGQALVPIVFWVFRLIAGTSPFL